MKTKDPLGRCLAFLAEIRDHRGEAVLVLGICQKLSRAQKQQEKA